LTDAAYLGQPDAALIESLHHFCPRLMILTAPSEDANLIGQFPLTILNNPNLDELQRAFALTCTGGFVYVEVCRSRTCRQRPLANRRQSFGIRSCVAEMQKQHVSELQVHWHWPTFESCIEMIPLDDRAAVICALRRRGTGIYSRWKSRFARVLLECRLLGNVVSCFSVLGRKL
jgi:hypothetical protein